jgi:NAD(P)-dependent dehydrogenase (short-subunit alcohol dehydrogenase family)
MINISSIASKLGQDSFNVSGASKAALDNLSAVWAGEVRSVAPVSPSRQLKTTLSYSLAEAAVSR